MFYDKLVKKVREMVSAQSYNEHYSLPKRLEELERARVFLFSTEQARVFVDRPQPLESYPHLPFPTVFLNFTETLRVGPEEIKGVSIDTTRFAELEPETIDNMIKRGAGDSLDALGLKPDIPGYSVQWYQPFPKSGDHLDVLSTQVAQHCFPEMGNKEGLEKYLDSTIKVETSKALHKLAVNLMYFISCENLEFEYHDHKKSPKEVKKLTKRLGQQTKQPFYTIRFKRRKVKTRTKATGKGTSHSYRYDVEGHFRHYTHERFKRHEDGTCKVIWVPGHQRGLEHELYVPALRDASKEPIEGS
jgi:hypothetical protein